MSAWRQGENPAVSLFGSEGELVLLRITVDPRLLEDLLEALARLDFPVNPELQHRSAQVAVEFPAYAGKVDEVRRMLRAYRFDPDALETTRMLALAAKV
jgi:hypothetical protein